MQHLLTRPALHVSQPRAEKGQGLVELALVIPVLVVIVIGVLDLGRMYYTVIIINNAAQEGARYLMQHPDDKGNNSQCIYYDIDGDPQYYSGPYPNTRCAALREAQGTIVRLDAIDIWITSCTDSDSDDICDGEFPVEVTVSGVFDPILWPDTLTFQRSVEMLVP